MRLQRQRRGDFGGSWLCNRRNACQKSLKITHTSEKSNSTAKTQVLLPKSCPLPADEPLRCHPRRPTCRCSSSANLPCISQPPSPDIRTYGSGSQLPTERAPPQHGQQHAAGSPHAAINSVCSARGVTAHFAGQVGFTIACSRGNLI